MTSFERNKNTTAGAYTLIVLGLMAILFFVVSWAPPIPKEIKEDETDDVTSTNALGNVALQTYTDQKPPQDANDEACDGMDDDSCNNRKTMGMA